MPLPRRCKAPDDYSGIAFCGILLLQTYGHADTLVTMDDSAIVLQTLQAFEESKQLFLQTIEIENRVKGPLHPHTLPPNPAGLIAVPCEICTSVSRSLLTISSAMNRFLLITFLHMIQTPI